MFKNVKILGFGVYIWNQHEKCIQISTNIPYIGCEICEILRICETQNDGETINGCVQSINCSNLCSNLTVAGIIGTRQELTSLAPLPFQGLGCQMHAICDTLCRLIRYKKNTCLSTLTMKRRGCRPYIQPWKKTLVTR